MYTIGIVTYHARFEKYFKPLVKKINKIFPGIEIICVLNGHPDQSLQLTYLDQATFFLKGCDNVRYLAHTDHQSLSRCWNQLILLSKTEHTLVLNDDTSISELFRTEFEPTVGTAPLITYNNSWSHFLISKALVKRVGWFDERFLGVGQEDGDYAYRMAMQEIPITNVVCDGLRNFVAPSSNPSFQAISKTSNGKYAAINEKFFNSKWLTPRNRPDISTFKYVSDFNEGNHQFTPVEGMETPDFYDVSKLTWSENTANKKTYAVSRVRLLVQRAYFVLGRKVARLLRRLT